MRKLIPILFLALFTIGCGDGELDRITGPDGVVKDKIEMRVFGTNLASSSVTIRHTNSTDGMTNFTGIIPYVMSFESGDESIFLYLEATTGAQSFNPTPTLQVQIFVNGKLFREGAAQGSSLYAQAAGTYRR